MIYPRHQLWQVKLTPSGEFVSAVFECLLCDKVVLSHNPTCAMMQVCQQCADKEPKREDIERIFAHGFDQRRAALVEIGWPFEEAEQQTEE